MSILKIRENCIALKAKFQLQYPSITEEDLQCNNGSMKLRMLENIQHKTGKNNDELHKIISKL
jgi:hypothetical protein